MIAKWLVVLCGATLGCSGTDVVDVGANPEIERLPTGKGIGTLAYNPFEPAFLPLTDAGKDADATVDAAADASKDAASDASKDAGIYNGIDYHGGALMTSGVTVNFIWYGTWTNNTATTILPDWAKGIGGTPYYAINATYYDKSSVHPSSKVVLGTQINDAYSQGKSLTDAKVATIVASALAAKKLPSSSDAIYFVLTSSDVLESSGFCKAYCGWHSSMSYGGTPIRFSFIGNPAQCPSACEPQAISPNANAAADAMASVMSHELDEAVTDPDMGGWWSTNGMENADKCAWTWGVKTALKTGAFYNVAFGGRNWLIQQNWVNAGGGYCAMK